MSQLQSCKVRLFSNATVAGLETDVNTWLAGQGSPAVSDNWQLVSVRVFYGTEYVAAITYTGD